MTPAGQALDRRTLTTPGGFCWWYGDVVDEDGNGVVVIGSFALPFLSRRDTLEVPAARPSLNVAVYEGGICTFYALQDLADGSANDAVQESCRWEDAATGSGRGPRVHFGQSTLGVDEVDGKLSFFADLDIDLPVGRCVGRVVIAGAPRRSDGHGLHTLGTPKAVEGGGIAHDWSPQMGPAQGTATLQIDGRDLTIAGSGYHDRNGALLPLTDQGIGWWLWCRADVDVDGRRESRIVYALWPEGGDGGDDGGVQAIGVATDDAGASRLVDIDIDIGDRHRTWLGMGEVRRLVVRERCADGSTRPFLVGEAAARVDSGPFYLRHTLRAGTDAAPAGTTGFLEVVDVTRIDRPWQRPFVKMRVSPSSSAQAQSASLWHPLFAGPRAGRVKRQLRWLMGNRGQA